MRNAVVFGKIDNMVAQRDEAHGVGRVNPSYQSPCYDTSMAQIHPPPMKGVS